MDNTNKYDASFFRNDKEIFLNTGASRVEFKLETLKKSDRDFPRELKSGLASYLKGLRTPVLIDAPCGKGVLLKEYSDMVGAKLEVKGFDLYNGEYSFVEPANLNEEIPASDHSADATISLFGIKYLNNPLEFLNETLRVTKKGGFIIANGTSSMHLSLRVGNQMDEVKFFSDYLNENQRRVKIYKFMSDGDWVIMQVLDPNFRFDFAMIDSYSTMSELINIDIRSGARFVYKPND